MAVNRLVEVFVGEENLTPEEKAEKRITEWKKNPRKGNKSQFSVWEDIGKNTKVLQLRELGLKKFPESIRVLINIENIDLAGNKIKKIPEWVGELKELKGINLERNQIQTLPVQIKELKQLQVLNLQKNHLEKLPNGMQHLALVVIKLFDNPKLELPDSILVLSPQEIFRYYFESRADDGQPLLELKLLLVGRGRAGKTTLIKRLAGEDPDENEPETHSISIREFMLECPKGIVRTRAWDFGGQEILHSTHQFFLTERSLYILVLEPRTGLASRDAVYWLKLIESRGGGSPVIVALNYSHGHEWRIDEVKLKRKFPFIVAFISTDALKSKDVKQLQKLIVKTIQEKIPDVWLPFPKHWRNIKNAVASMKENFLTYRQYANICKKFGENRPDAQADLAAILHALGLALYFGEDPRLYDTRVLNPGWVTGGVYAVIRSQFVERKGGQLLSSDMPNVLKEAQKQLVIKTSDYPPKTHRFILELMKAFQLCYSNEEEKSKSGRYLVPELLPEFEPELKDTWNEASVHLRYRYNILSPGLLSRFIVQTHALSEGAPHWRHGVVLKHSDAMCLIREELDSSELHIFALGKNKETRRVLVAIVRRELELLHGAMKMQPIEELELTGENNHWISVKALREMEEQDNPIQKLPIQPEGTTEVNVPLELDKLIPADVRAIERNDLSMPGSVHIFVSYAHEDERQLKRLDAILDVLEQQHGLTAWRDKRLIAGDEWDEQIKQRLEEMDIFLFIASQTSIIRPYIKNTEIKRAKERKKEEAIEVVAIKLEPCAVDEDAFLGKLHRLAPKFKSIAEAPLKSSAWEEVRKDLLPVIKRVQNKKKTKVKRVFVL